MQSWNIPSEVGKLITSAHNNVHNVLDLIEIIFIESSTTKVAKFYVEVVEHGSYEWLKDKIHCTFPGGTNK